MAVPGHLRLTVSGVFGTAAAPQERWSFTVNADDDNTATSESDFQAIGTGLATAYASNIASVMPANVVLTETRVARILGGNAGQPQGQTATRADGSYVQAVQAWDAAGAKGAINAPPQLAVCVSLVTGRAGASGKGRFFLPMVGFAPSLTDRRLTAADCGEVANAARDFVQDVNAITGFGGVVVASTKGYLSPVTAVRVGRAIDTIRSRRGDIPEGYVTAAV
jgi:hypothetical protein